MPLINFSQYGVNITLKKKIEFNQKMDV